MNIHLVRTKDFLQAELIKVYDLLFQIPGAMKFHLGKKTFLFEKDNFSWDDFFDQLEEYRITNNIPAEDFIVVITNKKNNQNWFSAFNLQGKKLIFIDGNNWEDYIYAEQKYPLAYEVVANIIHYHLYQVSNNFDFIHEESIGCISDFCGYKSEISLKLRTADICLDCLDILSEKLSSKEILPHSIEIIEFLRKGMLYTKMFHYQSDIDDGLPFPIALTKRKLRMTLQPYQKLQVLIEHFDSVVRTSVILFSNLFLTEESREKMIEDNRLSEYPALGSWVSALKFVLSNAVLPTDIELQPNILARLKEVYSILERNQIVNLRNELAHSYTDVRGPQYIKTFEEKSKILEDVENILNPIFKRWKYYQISQTKFLGNNEFELHVINFSGSNTAFIEEIIKVKFDDMNNLPITDKIYFTSNDQKKWICVDPYWIFNICPSCNHQRLLIIDGKQYIDPVVGHRVTC